MIDENLDRVVELHRVTMEFHDKKANPLYQAFTYKHLNASTTLDIHGHAVPVPSVAYNALYVFMHAWHHFESTGVGFRQLGDWALCLKMAHEQATPAKWQALTQLIPLLKQHKVDLVINLRTQHQDASILAGQSFQLIHVPIHTWSINRDDLLHVMRSIQAAQSKNQTVLIHCYHGSDRTGASVAMYRIIFENWKVQDALEEMKHGGYGFHPIWINIEKNFKPENIKWIREQLSNPSI